ncbi:transcriptional regulator, y4mF family [Nitrincola nitratireducens]|uniref:Transcriptional regulator, y4mF family n=1 Tax=Nitrincola nitratireducens TaxID=1229521 RepID=W9V6Q8_9GAMM|nr:transcriptional regulator, y4mF family [Nitrincola nitratireducens]
MGAHLKSLSGQEREAVLLKMVQALYQGETTEGMLLRTLRKQVLGLTQEQYAALVGISRRTLSDIERDKAQLTLSVMNRVFKPIGLKVGLLPRSPKLLQQVIQDEKA